MSMNASVAERFSIADTQYAEPVAYKDGRKAKYLAIIAGFFGFCGIGHLYIGLHLKGIAFLGIGLALDIAAFYLYLGLGQFMFSIIPGIAYLILWIWHISDVGKRASAFNLHLHDSGKKLW